jgi:hypothetical protein
MLAINNADELFEFVNVTLFASCLAGLFVFGRLILYYYKNNDTGIVWYRLPLVRAAMPIFVILFGIGILRGTVWMIRWLDFVGVKGGWTWQNAQWLVLAGVIVKLCGTLCLIRVFGYSWLYALAFIVAFVVLTRIPMWIW